MPSQKARLNLSRPQSENSPPLQRVPSSSLPCSPSFVADINDDDIVLPGSFFDCLPLSPPLSPWKQLFTPQHDRHEELSFFPVAPLSSFSALNTTSSPSNAASSALFSSSAVPVAKLSRESTLLSSIPTSPTPRPRLARQTSFLTALHSTSIHSPEFACVSASHAPEYLDHRVPFPYLARRPSASSHTKTAAPSELFSTAIDEILASAPSLHSNNIDNDDDEAPSARHQVPPLYPHDNRSLVSPDRLTANNRANSSTSTISRLNSSISSMSSESESSIDLSAASSGHDLPMVSDATSATTSATTSVSDPNLRGATNSDVDVSATSATEIEIKQESLVSLVALPSLTTQPHQPPLPTKQGEDEEVDQLADEYKETHALTANGHPAPSLVLDPAQSLKQELAAAAAAAAAALSITNLPSTDSEVHVDADGDITMKNESSVDVAALDTAMQVEPTISTAAELEAAAVVAAVVATTLPVVLPVPPTTTTTTTTTTTITTTTLPSATFVTVPLIPTVGVPNNVGEQDQLLSPSPSPQRPGSPSQLQQQQQQQERPSSHSPPSSSTSLKPTAGDTKPRSKSFDANAASAALATTTLATASSSTPSSSSSAAASGSTLPATTTGKAPRVRKGAPPTEKKPLKVYPPRKQRSRVNWDEAKVPPESPLSTLASAAVAVSTLSAATAITPASTMPITPTVSAAANGGAAGATTTASTAASAAAAAAAGGVGTGGAGVGNGSGSSGSSGAASSSAGGVGSSIGGSVPSVGASSGLATVGGAVPVTTHHAVPDDATLQALSKARAQLAAEGGGYRCELCPGERFGRVHDLKRHHISKHNEMTWPCDFCHRPFVRRDALLRHYTVKAARNDGVHPTQDEQDRLSEARARAKLLS